MSSLVSGYEYDIFISYRQNDNRSGWVTEFVKNLQEELSSTIKHPVSVYFDVDPHDGLLETHNVDKSLEGKLKCLIFIPILSQTYCDPHSFAWQHEFCAFNKQAKEDHFGRDVRLSNGNVTSRILPIKIHDLDAEDKSIIEAETGGVVRAIDFIFRSAGVNRPLAAHEEHPQDNLNKTFYRDQINKVANAIKDLIQAIKAPAIAKEIKSEKEIDKAPSKKKKVMTIAAFVLLTVSLAVYFVAPKWLSTKVESEQTSNSIAVLPFVNMSEDPEQEYFSDGITEQIITNLAHINSLKVIARTSVMKFKKTDKSIAEIGEALNVTHVLEGSIRMSGDRVRVTAQLISAKDETHLWAQDYDRPIADIFTVQDEVSLAIARSLQRRLTPREYERIKSERPSSVEAYQHFLKGYYTHFDVFYYKRLKEDFILSENEFKAAILLDPAYGLSYAGVADLYDTYRNFLARTREERLKFEALRDSCSAIAMQLSPNDPYVIAVRAYTFSGKTDRQDSDVDSSFKYMRQAHAIAPNNSAVCDQLSVAYAASGLYDQAIQLRERTIALDPTYGNFYVLLSQIYLDLGEFEKCEALVTKALLMEPGDLSGLYTYAYLQLQTGKLAEAEKTIQKMKAVNSESNTGWLESYLAALKGDKEKGLAQVQNFRFFLALDMKKEALDVLEKNSASQRYLNMKNSPSFDPFRKEPRFAAMLEKARLVYEERLKKYTN